MKFHRVVRAFTSGLWEKERDERIHIQGSMCIHIHIHVHIQNPGKGPFVSCAFNNRNQ